MKTTIAFLGMLLLAGCMADTTREAPAGAGVNVTFEILDSQGEAVRSFRSGERAHFVFRVHNAAAHADTLHYTFPPHRVRVLPQEGETTLWQAFAGRMFPQVMRSDTLAAGETVVFDVEWDLSATGGGLLAAGRYRVQPEFNAFAGPGREQLAATLPAIAIRIE